MYADTKQSWPCARLCLRKHPRVPCTRCTVNGVRPKKLEAIRAQLMVQIIGSSKGGCQDHSRELSGTHRESVLRHALPVCIQRQAPGCRLTFMCTYCTALQGTFPHCSLTPLCDMNNSNLEGDSEMCRSLASHAAKAGLAGILRRSTNR